MSVLSLWVTTSTFERNPFSQPQLSLCNLKYSFKVTLNLFYCCYYFYQDTQLFSLKVSFFAIFNSILQGLVKVKFNLLKSGSVLSHCRNWMNLFHMKGKKERWIGVYPPNQMDGRVWKQSAEKILTLFLKLAHSSELKYEGAYVISL